jgi:hypothetical protein
MSSAKPRGRAWAVAAFLLGIAMSIAANIAHVWHPTPETLQAAHTTAADYQPEIGAQVTAAFYPVALLLTVEILVRVPWPGGRLWSLARYVGAGVVATVAAVVSYRHMAGLLAAYGEDDLTAAIGPLAVDGLMVVASFALLAIGRQTAHEPVAGAVADPAVRVPDIPRIGTVFDTPADRAGHGPKQPAIDMPTDTPAEVEPADQTLRIDLESAVRTAYAAGLSKASIQREFGVKRYRLDRILAGTQPAALNGHQPTREDDTP